MKHTPLPWIQDYGQTIGHIKAIVNSDKQATPTVCRYDVNTISISKDERDANAQFIVKACNEHYKQKEINADLLAALKEMVISLTERGGISMYDIALAQEAIKKAES